MRTGILFTLIAFGILTASATCLAFPDGPIDPVKQALGNLLLDGEEAILAIEEKIQALRDKLTFNNKLTSAEKASIRVDIQTLETQLEATEIEVGKIVTQLNSPTPPLKPTIKPCVPKPIITETLPQTPQQRINNAIKDAFTKANLPPKFTAGEYLENIESASFKNDVFPAKPTTPQLKVNTAPPLAREFNPHLNGARPVNALARANAWIIAIEQALSFGKATGIIPDKITAPPRNSWDIQEEIRGIQSSLAWYENNRNNRNGMIDITQSAIDAQKNRLKELAKELEEAEKREREWYRRNMPDPRNTPERGTQGGWSPLS